MAKIGRNEPCPCGSGMKYKKCCLSIAEQTGSTPTRQEITVSEEVAKFQQRAARGEASLQATGVFIYCSTADGDAWLFEATENDALQLACGKKAIPVEISEDQDEIGIKWSHQFEIKDQRLETRAYADNSIESHTNYPVSAIKAEIAAIMKNVSPHLIKGIHIKE